MSMDNDYNYNDEMCTVASNCKNFSRRRDVNSFSMATYQSCENCGHFTADYRCNLKNDENILFRMHD